MSKRSETFREYSSKWGKMMMNLRNMSTKQRKEDEAIQTLQGAITLCMGTEKMINISISFIQELYANRSLTIGPILIISCTLTEDAEVFTVIKNGDLDALMQLLQHGEVKLGSRDPDGRSLLNARTHPTLMKAS